MPSTYATAPPQHARQTVALLHASAYLGLLGGVAFILGPLLVWLLRRDDDPAIDAAGKEAVNFHLTMILGMVVGGVLTILLVGFAVLAVVGLLCLVCPGVAALRASNGEGFRYPLTIRFLK